MPTNKKIFLIVTVLFIAAMIYVTIDIFSKTTRPGGKRQLQERIERRIQGDSLKTDTTQESKE